MDHRDDSNKPRHDPDSIAEETSATGQRFKGAVKNAAGEALGDEEWKKKASVKTLPDAIDSRRTTPSR